ncbi:hypothetical protein DM02DRAFT_430222 [Periconia macrospinosa]|uniref:Uncharacterized protein n=1 Tax=Periconia macrospinosa TaxID=97972 RepID=A0A2V1DN74_9PLEO|nr:hypothetical protein DM02DRAFT_430222 [Periconia macrospinosa]
MNQGPMGGFGPPGAFPPPGMPGMPPPPFMGRGGREFEKRIPSTIHFANNLSSQHATQHGLPASQHASQHASEHASEHALPTAEYACRSGNATKHAIPWKLPAPSTRPSWLPCGSSPGHATLPVPSAWSSWLSSCKHGIPSSPARCNSSWPIPPSFPA